MPSSRRRRPSLVPVARTPSCSARPRAGSACRRARPTATSRVARASWRPWRHGRAKRSRPRCSRGWLAVPARADPRTQALDRFRATGAAYFAFALAEPGLFRVAFAPCEPSLIVRDDPSPYEILSSAIDAVADTGALPASRRRHAEEVAWSAVHGAAVLIGDGLIGVEDERDRSELIDRVLDGVVHGLADTA